MPRRSSCRAFSLDTPEGCHRRARARRAVRTGGRTRLTRTLVARAGAVARLARPLADRWLRRARIDRPQHPAGRSPLDARPAAAPARTADRSEPWPKPRRYRVPVRSALVSRRALPRSATLGAPLLAARAPDRAAVARRRRGDTLARRARPSLVVRERRVPVPEENQVTQRLRPET